MVSDARCYTQQIFSSVAAGIDGDISLSDYRDVLAKAGAAGGGGGVGGRSAGVQVVRGC